MQVADTSLCNTCQTHAMQKQCMQCNNKTVSAMDTLGFATDRVATRLLKHSMTFFHDFWDLKIDDKGPTFHSFYRFSILSKFKTENRNMSVPCDIEVSLQIQYDRYIVGPITYSVYCVVGQGFWFYWFFHFTWLSTIAKNPNFQIPWLSTTFSENTCFPSFQALNLSRLIPWHYRFSRIRGNPQ